MLPTQDAKRYYITSGNSKIEFWVWLGAGQVTPGTCNRKMTTQPRQVVTLANIALFKPVSIALVCSALENPVSSSTVVDLVQAHTPPLPPQEKQQQQQ